MSGTTPLIKSQSSGSLVSTSSTSTASTTAATASTLLWDRHHIRPVRAIRLLCAAFLFAVAIAAVCALLHWLSATSGGLNTRHDLHHHHHHRQQQQRNGQSPNYAAVSLDVADMPTVALAAADAELAAPRESNCSHWDCFDVYRCGHSAVTDRMSVYVYPLERFVDAETQAPAAPLSRDFHRVLRAIRESRYYTADPHEACVFVPSLDLLNQNRVDGELAGRALAALDYWDNGHNHLLFNMVPGSAPHYNTTVDVHTDRAMLAGAGFDTWTYRHGFDLAIPFYKLGLSDASIDVPAGNGDRPYLLIAAQMNMYGGHNRILQELAYNHQHDLLVLQPCTGTLQADDTPAGQRNDDGVKAPPPEQGSTTADAPPPTDWRCTVPGGQRHRYPNVLAAGRFCLVARGMRLVPLNLMESMAAGCVPVVMADNLVLPFDEVLDWTLASIRIREMDLHSVMQRLQGVSAERHAEMSAQARWLYARYFGSLERVVHTVLEQLNDRIFPHVARDQRVWNQAPSAQSVQNPLFLAMTAARAPGFTAVVLTYDRVESLFTLIEKLSIVPSLHKILVVWNNQKKAPPHINQFPKIAKPLQLIRTTANKLSNRFYPYADIETEAILTIDDDIVMLTADELDFGYEVWREFPDRIVGFPSRTHVWDNGTARWRYESEWTNEISMVLTGAAFHHKYWSYMYTTAMPGDIKQWVDEHMNCEDIAMNFLVANITGQPAIKVAPRKKFKCPECTNTEMLSADLNHMLERSACIDRFAKIYGRMPLRTVEFRADPVLYKDNFPEKLKRFNDIGSL